MGPLPPYSKSPSIPGIDLRPPRRPKPKEEKPRSPLRSKSPTQVPTRDKGDPLLERGHLRTIPRWWSLYSFFFFFEKKIHSRHAWESLCIGYVTFISIYFSKTLKLKFKKKKNHQSKVHAFELSPITACNSYNILLSHVLNFFFFLCFSNLRLWHKSKLEREKSQQFQLIT